MESNGNKNKREMVPREGRHKKKKRNGMKEIMKYGTREEQCGLKIFCVEGNSASLL
jgi:hypothetical protein